MCDTGNICVKVFWIPLNICSVRILIVLNALTIFAQERCSEAIPDSALPAPPPMLNYSVYTDMKMVETHLTHPSFHFLHSKKDADILWLSEHFKNFR